MELVRVGELVRGRLVIRKAKNQLTEWFNFPVGMTIEQIKAIWQEQGGDWDQIYLDDKRPPIYIAKRALWLPKGLCVMWDITHISNIAHDQCGIIPLTKEEWTSGLAAAVAKRLEDA